MLIPRDKDQRSAKFNAYVHRTDLALSLLAGIFIALYALEVLIPSISGIWQILLAAGNYGIWSCFVIDLLIRLCLSPSRVRYLLSHPIDVLAVVLPALRSLRILRIFASGQVLLSKRYGLAQAGQSIILSAGLLIIIGALAVLDAERGAAGTLITSFPDALWWAITTLTTVGYGDLYPVTITGRAVATALMLIGISLIGIVTASIASWFVVQTTEHQSEQGIAQKASEDELKEEIKDLRLQVEGMTRLLDNFIKRVNHG